MARQTAVEWLAEKYNYITWMRNRDEMSPETADNRRQYYLEQAKAMEREQQFDFFIAGQLSMEEGGKDFQQYLKLWPSLTIDTK